MNSTVQGLENYSEPELVGMIQDYIARKLEEAGIDIYIDGIELIGSRTTGTARMDSDLDAILWYQGDEREDDIFNILHDEDDPLYIEDFKVDINPKEVQ